MIGNVNVKYHRLSQSTPSDDEDEDFPDNILFDSRLVNTSTDYRRNPLDFERIGLPKSRIKGGLFGHVCSKYRQAYAVAVVVLLLIITVSAVLFPILHQSTSPGNITSFNYGSAMDNWDLKFDNKWTESSIYLHDLDGDHLDDIIIGLSDQGHMEALLNRAENLSMKNYCKHQGSSYPCGGTLNAFRGKDGSPIWTSATRSVVIYQNCGDIDVNGDTLKDCIVTGRHSTCQAVDLRSGELLWVVDPDAPSWSSHFMPGWNVYQAVALPDLDEDGFADLLVSHGGDKDKEPWNHDREAGRLIILSGKTGIPIGKSFVTLPDNEETYMPPVKHVSPNGAIYILIGSGGETVPGNLYAISLIDIYKKASGSTLQPKLPFLNSALYDWLVSQEKDPAGFITILRGQSSGVMVPPVVIYNNQGELMDILASSFDGQIVLLDGPSLTVKWSRTFQGMESYSTPCPGLFNEDEVYDFMVHLNEGVWDQYNSSQTLILNGLDGSTLWSVDAKSYAYSSDLSLHTDSAVSDVFLLKLVGINSNNTNVIAYEDLTKRHLNYLEANNISSANMSAEEFQAMCNDVMSEMALEHPTCEKDLQSLTQDVLLMDHQMSKSLLRVMQVKAERYHYQLNHTIGSYHCHSLSSRQKDKIDMCAVLVPTSYTGAVSDVDGDGNLDYIHIAQMIGDLKSDTLSSLGSISYIALSKRTLQKVIDKKEIVHLNTEMKDNALSHSIYTHLQSMKFSQQSTQTWNQYLGRTGHSFYNIPKH